MTAQVCSNQPYQSLIVGILEPTKKIFLLSVRDILFLTYDPVETAIEDALQVFIPAFGVIEIRVPGNLVRIDRSRQIRLTIKSFLLVVKSQPEVLLQIVERLVRRLTILKESLAIENFPIPWCFPMFLVPRFEKGCHVVEPPLLLGD